MMANEGIIFTLALVPNVGAAVVRLTGAAAVGEDALTQGDWVEWEYSVRAPSQAVTAVTQGRAQAGSGGEAELDLALPNRATFVLRARCRFQWGYTVDTEPSAWTAYQEITFTALQVLPPPALPGQLPYLELLRPYLLGKGFASVAAADATALALAHDGLFSAYRYCYGLWRWHGAQREESVLVGPGGLVSWAQLGHAEYYALWTADPKTADGTALEVRADGRGVWLPLAAGAVAWAVYTPRCANFGGAVPVVGGTSYALGAVVYVAAEGQLYQCISTAGALGSALADGALWRRLSFLWELAEPTVLLALAKGLGHEKYERAQALTLRQEANDLLGEALSKQQNTEDE